MKVKIGDKVYDSHDQPIMIILSDKDKKNITNMAPVATKYCSFPNQLSVEDVRKWMIEE